MANGVSLGWEYTLPAIGLAAFTIGDIAAFGAASIARKMPGWYRAM